ncbi:Dynein regulatory complex subunit 6, partial [Podila epigama]
AILDTITRRGLSSSTREMILRLDMSYVEETLYSTLPDNWLLTLLRNLPRLHVLNLSGKRTGAAFVQSQSFRKVANAQVVHLGMENLDLSDCTDLREQAIKSIPTIFPNLVSVNFCRTSGVTDLALALVVDKCQYLETVDLSYARQVTDLGLFSVAKFCRRNLRVLRLDGNLKITDASLMAVAKHCPMIERLFLSECSQITDAALEWIVRSPSSLSLKELELHRCDKIAFGLPLLELLSGKCHVLERLTLAYKQINSKRDDLKLVMEAFRDFRRLHTLAVYEVPEHSPALFFWDLAFQCSRGQLRYLNLHRGTFATDYILGHYTDADEHDQNISNQTVAKFNDLRNGAVKALVRLFADNIYQST